MIDNEKDETMIWMNIEHSLKNSRLDIFYIKNDKNKRFV